MGGNISYKDSGVDIDKGNRFVDVIKPLVKTTFRKEVMGGLGGFGGLFHLDKAFRAKVPSASLLPYLGAALNGQGAADEPEEPEEP